MAKREKPPAPMIRLTAKGLLPLTAGDAEELNAFANGTTFTLKAHNSRSLEQLRLYWKVLGEAVKATGICASKEHLHDDLKIATGFTRKSVNHDTGEVHLVPDSTALDAMTPEEYRVFFDTAMAKLASWIGYDPMRWEEAS